MYPYCRVFEKFTGLDLSSEDKFKRNHLPELIKASVNSKFILIENAASDVDMLQLNNLCLVLGCEPRYGLSQLTNNILCWVYEAGTDAPHNAQEFPPIVFIINDLIEHFDDDLFDNDNIYIYIINEMWNERFKILNEKKKALQQKEEKIIMLKKSANVIKNDCSLFKQIDVQNEIIIAEKNNRYNHIKIYDDFEPNSMYKYTVNSISVIFGETDSFSIVVRDADQIDFIESFYVCTVGGTIYFTTNENTQTKELRIYTGETGKASNISIKIGESKLYKFDPEG